MAAAATTIWSAGAGATSSRAGPGNDTINAVEPYQPLSEALIACGPGHDTVFIDRRDARATRFRDCEVVTPGQPPPPVDPNRGSQSIGSRAADLLQGGPLNDTLLGGWGGDTAAGRRR